MRLRLLLFLPVIGIAAALATGVGAAELRVGDVAPPFQLVGSDGKTYELKSFQEKRAVVLAWFPKAFTGG